MNFIKVIGKLALISVCIIACAGTSEKSGTEQLAEETETSHLNEPWTGVWKVEGTFQAENDGLWVLKQSDNSVVSTKDSQSKVEGKVAENQLEGRVHWERWRHQITLNISSDGQSFKGLYIMGSRPYNVIGIKQK